MIKSIVVKNRKEEWIKRAAKWYIDQGICQPEDEKIFENSSRYLGELLFDSYIQSTDGTEYYYSPEEAAAEDLTYWY